MGSVRLSWFRILYCTSTTATELSYNWTVPSSLGFNLPHTTVSNSWRRINASNTTSNIFSPGFSILAVSPSSSTATSSSSATASSPTSSSVTTSSISVFTQRPPLMSTSPASKKRGLSTGAKAGIKVGYAVGGLLVLIDRSVIILHTTEA
jgi:hypothetical protein